MADPVNESTMHRIRLTPSTPTETPGKWGNICSVQQKPRIFTFYVDDWKMSSALMAVCHLKELHLAQNITSSISWPSPPPPAATTKRRRHFISLPKCGAIVSNIYLSGLSRISRPLNDAVGATGPELSDFRMEKAKKVKNMRLRHSSVYLKTSMRSPPSCSRGDLDGLLADRYLARCRGCLPLVFTYLVDEEGPST